MSKGEDAVTKKIETGTETKSIARKRNLDPHSPTFAEDFAVAARLFTRKATRSPEAALAVLVTEGILTPTGKLSKNYR